MAGDERRSNASCNWVGRRGGIPAYFATSGCWVSGCAISAAGPPDQSPRATALAARINGTHPATRRAARSGAGRWSCPSALDRMAKRFQLRATASPTRPRSTSVSAVAIADMAELQGCRRLHAAIEQGLQVRAT
jgi:hypothetical protein